MVAYDSRRMPDPDKLLRPETAAALLEAFRAQLTSGDQPTAELSEAIRRAAHEARARSLPPETLIIQLKAIAEQAGVPPVLGEDESRRQIRQWMVTMSLRAYWDSQPG